MPFDNLDFLDKHIDMFRLKCIDKKNNYYAKTDECKRLYIFIQSNLLKIEDKKTTGVGVEPTSVTITSKLPPFPGT